ncbi:MAG: sugar phosphate nucleotidyltransferase, partial [Pseudomonadota bacterium]
MAWGALQISVLFINRQAMQGMLAINHSRMKWVMIISQTTKLTPVILCGGAGSRLWPLSRDEKPKQFHALFNEKSLLMNTMQRMPFGVFNGAQFTPAIILGSLGLRDTFAAEFSDTD